MFEIFVTYNFPNGSGRTFFECSFYPPTEEMIIKMENVLKEKYKMSELAIVNFILLREKSAEKTDIDLSGVSTKALIEELRSRSGVDFYYAGQGHNLQLENFENDLEIYLQKETIVLVIDEEESLK